MSAQQPAPPESPDQYPGVQVGRLSKAYALDPKQGGAWLRSAQAAQLSGVGARNLNKWAHRGLITSMRWSATGNLRYLRKEMEILRDMAVDGRIPTARTVSAHVRLKVAQRAETAKGAKW